MVLLHLCDESQTRLADFLLYPTMQIEKSERSQRGIVASCENTYARDS